MRHSKIYGFVIILLLVASCQPPPSETLLTPGSSLYKFSISQLSRDAYYDKVLGALVGSAIGDAMGAGTEMWHRSEIQKEYGYIHSLTRVTRTKSPEGTWAHNMVDGATTDDTRWKFLMTLYLLENTNNITATSFTDFIISYYQEQVRLLSNADTQTSTERLDDAISQIDWIKEWARVALARKEGGISQERALHRFYGGEMSCAGLLYAPMIGLIQDQPTDAYVAAYDLAMFDIGYARDITALSASMSSMAVHNLGIDSIIASIKMIDPFFYKDSRLIGRLTESIVNESMDYVSKWKEKKLEDSTELIIPKGYPGTDQEWYSQEGIYQELESRQKAIAFHSGEIFQILITGMLFGEGDFLNTLSFIVNYGRDNDTVAAIAGFILGASEGFSNLPVKTKTRILSVNKELIGIDLERLATQLTDEYYPGIYKE